MSDHDALLAAVLAAPDDDTPRLIYADYLEETGDPAAVARAHFIRLEIAAERLPPGDQEREPLETEAARLFNRFGDDWSQELPPWATRDESRVVYHRGFVDGLTTSIQRLTKDGQSLLRIAPVRAVRLRSFAHFDVSADHVAWPTYTWPDLSNLVTLQIGPGVRDAWWEREGGPPNWDGFLLRQLVAYPSLRQLRRLELNGNWLPDEFLHALVRRLREAVFCPTLSHLDLSDNELTDAGASLLCAIQWLGALRELNLSSNRISDRVQSQLRHRFGDRVVL